MCWLVSRLGSWIFYFLSVLRNKMKKLACLTILSLFSRDTLTQVILYWKQIRSCHPSRRLSFHCSTKHKILGVTSSWKDLLRWIFLTLQVLLRCREAVSFHQNTKITVKNMLNHTLALLTHSMTLGFLTNDTGFKELYYGLMRNWLDCGVADL